MSKKKRQPLTTKRIIVALLFLIAGCSQPQNNQQRAMLSDLKLGMQISDVREIHNKDLTPIAFESRQGYDLVHYRGWFIYGTENNYQPYKLTFELYPPITRVQCQYIAAKNNITDPNELAKLYSIIGLRPSSLIQVALDETALQQAAIDEQNAIMWQKHFNQQAHTTAPSSLQIDAYGPGVHMNKYGQPVKLKPDFGGVQGEMLQIRPDAYGPGIHMDQYGRPVREYPWP